MAEELGEEMEEETGEQEADAEEEGEEVSTASGEADGEGEDEPVGSGGTEGADGAQEAPEWVRSLRQRHRELQKENRSLAEKLTALQPREAAAKKPTLESADYDEGRYERELESWYAKKRAAEDAEDTKRREEEEQKAAWTAKLERYEQKKAALAAVDYEDAEENARDVLSVTQQGIIVHIADNPAALVYHIGKNPDLAHKIAGIKDPTLFAAALTKLEIEMKSKTGRATLAPEKPVRGSGRPSGTVDSALERLRAEAEKTGDFSKVVAYRRRKK